MTDDNDSNADFNADFTADSSDSSNDGGDQPTWFANDDPRGDLGQLVARRDELLRELRQTDEPERRSELALQVRALSEHVANLTADSAIDGTGRTDGSSAGSGPWPSDPQTIGRSAMEWPDPSGNTFRPEHHDWPEATRPPGGTDHDEAKMAWPDASRQDPEPPDPDWPYRAPGDDETLTTQWPDVWAQPTGANAGETTEAGWPDDVDPAAADEPDPAGFEQQPRVDRGYRELYRHQQDGDQQYGDQTHPPRPDEPRPPYAQNDWGGDRRDHQHSEPAFGADDANRGPAERHSFGQRRFDEPDPGRGHRSQHAPADPALFENAPFEATVTDRHPATGRPVERDPYDPEGRHRTEAIDFDSSRSGPVRDRSDSEPIPLSTAASSSGGRSGFNRPSGPVLAVVGISLAVLAALLWLGDSGRSTGSAGQSIDPAAPQAAPVDGDVEATLANIRAVLQGLGLSEVVVSASEGVIHVAGSVPSQAEHDAVSNAVRTIAETFPVDTTGLVVESGAVDVAQSTPDAEGRARSLQTELDRILASTPLIFGAGQSALSELHQRILNNAVIALMAYPGFDLTIAGYTDDLGDDAVNRQLSLARAENVQSYLVSQGLPPEAFHVEARGEEASTGAAGLAGLERRVELEVNGTAAAGPQQGTLRVAIVAPSASNDLAFTQSMVDAVNRVAGERPVELAVTDNTFVPDDAAAAVRGYAEQGFDLVIAHGSQFGASLIDIAPQYPGTTFAWGTASDTFGLPNVYAYDAAAEEGGYVLGALAGLLTNSNVIGVVGPIEVGDAAQYVNGFTAGAQGERPGTEVRTIYTGSFSDIGLASEAAQSHVGAGADVMTGSAQMVVGAIALAEQQGVLWFGTQSNQASLAPEIVVASQVYHWEVVLRPILDDIAAGRLSGASYTANLANGGLVIEYNPDYPLSPEARQRADELGAAIAAGSITPPK